MEIIWKFRSVCPDLYTSVSEHISTSDVFFNIKSFLLLGPVVSAVLLPQLSSDRQLSPALHNEVVTSEDLSSELSPPRSPQLRSTARDHSRYHLASLSRTVQCFAYILWWDSEYQCLCCHCVLQSTKATASLLQLRVFPTAWEDKPWRSHWRIIRYSVLFIVVSWFLFSIFPLLFKA